MAIVLDGTNGITSPGGDTSSTSHTTPIVKSASSLTFQTNGTTTALAIGTTGELSIGSFSQSNNDPAVIKGIEMGAAGNLVYGTGGSQSGLMTNLYYNGGWKVAQTGNAASMYYQLDGQHTFTGTAYATSAGSAGDAASVTTLVSFTKDKSLALQGASTQTGTGITFPASQSASTNPNTLDDYEEGTWSPELRPTSGGSYSWGTQQGRYIKIGRQVTLHGFVQFSVVGSAGTGQMYLQNFPFATANSNNLSDSSSVSIGRSGGWSGTHPVCGAIVSQTGTTAAELYQRTVTTGASSDLPASAMTAGAYITFSITYTAAA